MKVSRSWIPSFLKHLFAPRNLRQHRRVRRQPSFEPASQSRLICVTVYHRFSAQQLVINDARANNGQDSMLEFEQKRVSKRPMDYFTSSNNSRNWDWIFIVSCLKPSRQRRRISSCEINNKTSRSCRNLCIVSRANIHRGLVIIAQIYLCSLCRRSWFGFVVQVDHLR